MPIEKTISMSPPSGGSTYQRGGDDIMATRLSKAYLLTKVLTATNHEVILYLYEGAISYLHRATTALDEGRDNEARQAIDRATNIVVELSGSLNYASGGSLALRLDAIYNHLIETL